MRCLKKGCFEAGFVSSAHSEDDIQNTVDAAKRVFESMHVVERA